MIRAMYVVEVRTLILLFCFVNIRLECIREIFLYFIYYLLFIICTLLFADMYMYMCVGGL